MKNDENNHLFDTFSAKLDEEMADRGEFVIMQLMAGPEYWESIPTLEIPPWQARAAAQLMRLMVEKGVAGKLPTSFLDSQAELAHHAIDTLTAEMEMWAVANGREDLLLTPIALINQNLPADEQIEEPS